MFRTDIAKKNASGTTLTVCLSQLLVSATTNTIELFEIVLHNAKTLSLQKTNNEDSNGESQLSSGVGIGQVGYHIERLLLHVIKYILIYFMPHSISFNNTSK